MPRRAAVQQPQPTMTTTNAATLTGAAHNIGDLAARMRVGQVCEAGCGKDARWGAVAPTQVHFGCEQHLVQLLDRAYIWFLHPIGD
jgi:hypothetical protein